MKLVGVILAGGRSRRFGSEKAVANHRGRPMIAWVADALTAGCGALAVNAPEGSGAAEWANTHGCPLLPDPPGSPDGPLTGVLEGLRWAALAGCDVLVTAPCDTPGLPTTFVSRIVETLADAPCAYAVTPGGAHPACAAWHIDRLPLLEAILAEGHPSIRRLLDGWGAAQVRFPDDAAFANINTPGEASTAVRTAP